MSVCRMQFKEEMLRKRYDEETGSLAEARAKQEAEEHQALMEWNNQENERLRKIRWVDFTLKRLCLSPSCPLR